MLGYPLFGNDPGISASRPSGELPVAIPRNLPISLTICLHKRQKVVKEKGCLSGSAGTDSCERAPDPELAAGHTHYLDVRQESEPL
jgi:hypothetical protein